MISGTHWRAMRPDDVDDVDDIAARVHVDFPEPKSLFANRQALYPAGSRMFEAQGSGGPQALGYMLAHPWPSDRAPPKLGLLLEALPVADALYLHDIALLPEARGTGAGASALQYLVELGRAEGFARIWLTAVSGADRYWAQNGFGRVGKDAPYGDGTMVMEYRLT